MSWGLCLPSWLFCGCKPLPSGPLVPTATPSPLATSQAGFRFSVPFSWVQGEPRPWRLKGLELKSTEASLQAGVGQQRAGALGIGPHGCWGPPLGVGPTSVWGWKQAGSVDSICASEPAHASPSGATVFIPFPGRVQRQAHSFELTLPLSPGSFRNQAPAWTGHGGLGALQPCSSPLCLAPDLALLCVTPPPPRRQRRS